MKHSIVFNHDAEDVASAVGTSVDAVGTTLAKVTREYMTNDAYQKRSHLAMLVADSFTEEEIVFLASQTVFEKMEQVQEDLQKFAMLKEMFSDED